MLAIDADSHFVEPLDLYEKYIDPQFRDRAFKVQIDPATRLRQMVVDNKALQLLDVEELLSAISRLWAERERPRPQQLRSRTAVQRRLGGHGQADQIPRPGGIRRAGHLPHRGLVMGGQCERSRAGRRALPRVQHVGTRALRVAQGPAVSGGPSIAPRSRAGSAGAASVWPNWDVTRFSLARHLTTEKASGIRFTIRCGRPLRISIWRSDCTWWVMLIIPEASTSAARDPGFMWVTMNVIQDPRIALATMVYDGVFDRFPRLRVATIEAMAGWVGEWLERFEYRYKYMKHTSRMKRSPDRVFRGEHLGQRRSRGTDVPDHGAIRRRRQILHRLRLSARGRLR